MGKRKGNFGGTSPAGRKQMAGPNRRPQAPPRAPRQPEPLPPPPAPSAAPQPRPPPAAERVVEASFQVRITHPRIPEVAVSDIAMRHMATAAFVAGIPDWHPLTDSQKAARDRKPVIVIEDPAIRNPLTAHVTFDEYPQPTYAIVAPVGARNQVLIIPRYKTKLAFFGVIQDGIDQPCLGIGCRRVRFIVNHFVTSGLQLACLCAALPYERHHLIVRTIVREPEENKTFFIPVSTPYPWLAYYIVANREVRLTDHAAARMAISSRYLHCPADSLVNRCRMSYSLSAHLEALLFYNKNASDPTRCTFVFAAMGGHLSRGSLYAFVRREDVAVEFDDIYRFITNSVDFTSDYFPANISFIEENLEPSSWTAVGKSYDIGDMIPALRYTPEFRALNNISPPVSGGAATEAATSCSQPGQPAGATSRQTGPIGPRPAEESEGASAPHPAQGSA
jgi:hypothetical protein